MVDQDYPESSGDSEDTGQNRTHDHEGQKHANEQDAKENILSNIRSMMMGDGGTGTSTSQPTRRRGMPGITLWRTFTAHNFK